MTDDEKFKCWCGAEGTYEELFDDSGLPDGCGGLGVVDCECGGDMCVCHHHGEAECPGCDECCGDEDDDWDEEYDE